MGEIAIKGSEVDWQDERSHVFFNSYLHHDIQADSVLRQLPAFSGHIWLATSGTLQTDTLRLVALSKKAFAISAQAVNDHLQATSKDVWLNVLPSYHVGGLAIYTRAHLLGCQVFTNEDKKWSADRFVNLLKEHRATLSSIVPTQVFDLVGNELRAPENLRGVIVGGGALSETLYRRARALGWPLLPSYGLTECCSQVATAPLKSLASELVPDLVRLNHIKWHTNGEGSLMINSAALLSAYAFIREGRTEIFDPKDSGWFVTEDLAEINGDLLILRGRKDDRVKVNGELVDLFAINRKILSMIHYGNLNMAVQVIATPHERSGQQIDLVAPIKALNSLPPLVTTYNLSAPKIQRVHNIYFVDTVPQTVLGKVQVRRLLQELHF